MNIEVSQVALATRVNASLFDGCMRASQQRGVSRYMAVWLLLKSMGERIPVSYLAYTLATVYHETAYNMQPVSEIGKGEGYDYGIPDEATGQTYYGRGDVQVTWKRNYERLSSQLFNLGTLRRGIDLVTHPDRLLIPLYSAQAAIIGMKSGLFTGKQYSDYLDQEEPDYVGARQIINGRDKAEVIAGYAKEFERAVKLAFGGFINRATLSKGSRGADVRELQLNLNQQPDGIFGLKTRDAVIAFQDKNELESDGIVGRNTWKQIEDEFYWGLG